MQDVCISFWQQEGKSDMVLKVTDLCSTDPNDPNHCANPGEMKIDRAKAKIWHHLGSAPQEIHSQAPSGGSLLSVRLI